MSDPMHNLLDQLAKDATRAPLADPSAVRRRGDRRQRNQVAASVVVGVAAVAAVALIAPNSLDRLTNRNSNPPASQEPSVSASPSTSATVDKPRTVSLLSAEQLPAPTSGTWIKQPSLEGSYVTTCLSSAGFPVGFPSYQQGYATKAAPTPLDEAALTEVIDLGSADAAKLAMTNASNAIRRCWFSSFSSKVTAGDEGMELSGTFKPNPSKKAVSAQTILLVRVGPELGIVAMGVDGKDDIAPVSPFLEVLGKKSGKALAELLAIDKGPTGPEPSAPTSVTASAPAVLPSDAVHLLTPGDLPGPSAGSWQTTSPLKSSALNHCFAGFDGAGQVDYTKWYATKADPAPGDEAAFNQVIATGSAAAAHEVFVKLQDAIDNCWLDVGENWAMPAGDEAVLLYGGYDDGADNARSMQSVVLVRVGNNVAVFAIAEDGNGDLQEYQALHDQVPQQLATLLNTHWTP